MTTELEKHARDWLSDVGYRILGETEPPDAVSMHQDHSALIATLDFGQHQRRMVIKKIPTSRSICSPEQFYGVHENLRAVSPEIAASTPRFLGSSPAHGFFVMEYIAGTPLQAHLVGAWGRIRERPEVDSLIYQAGKIVAQVHRVRPADLGMSCVPRKNGTFVDSLEERWRETHFLPKIYLKPERLLRRLSSAFFERSGDRLHVVDCQPKNLLIAAGDSLRIIDLNYCWANPALGVGYFLASLDRLIFSLPLGLLRREGVQCWKRSFLKGYFSRAEPAVAQDLVFFYPWTLLQLQKLHVCARPHWARLLRRVYARALTEFLLNLEDLSPPDAERHPELLFR